MIVEPASALDDPRRAALRARYRMDETECVHALGERVRLSAGERATVGALANELVVVVRAGRGRRGGIDAFLHEYGLSTPEGVILLCVAEALLRIPDAATQDRLIRDKIGGADWQTHLGRSESLFVNASTWGLMLTGRVVRLDRDAVADWREAVERMVARAGEPVIRNAVTQAMRILGRQ